MVFTENRKLIFTRVVIRVQVEDGTRHACTEAARTHIGTPIMGETLIMGRCTHHAFRVPEHAVPDATTVMSTKIQLVSYQRQPALPSHVMLIGSKLRSKEPRRVTALTGADRIRRSDHDA